MVFVDGPLPLAAGLYPPDCRMAIAKDLLRSHDIGLAEVAERIGYGSASTFSTAFSRYMGQPPGRYARTLHG
jgi:AraC-like DNA-binding protein